jgi:choline dehydrogenase-like flavoprotein
MIIEGKNINKSIEEERPDICIIGSGAAGAILAWELAVRNHTVVVLEKGGYYKRSDERNDFTQREDEMIPALYKNAGLQFAVPAGIAIAQGSCVGGSTVVNDAVCFRTPDAVLEDWEEKYRIENISSRHMNKYFDKVEKRISVCQVRQNEINKNNQMLKDGCLALGWDAHPNMRNCKNCKQCGLCHLGCYYGTKQSMLETYIHDIEEDPDYSEAVKIYANCQAEKIIVSGNRVVGIKGEITGNNEQKFMLSIKPKVLIISAGAISSSELLLRNGLRRKDLVGKRIALHPSPAIIGDFNDEINGHQGIPFAYHCSQFSILKTGRPGYMIESLFLPPYQFALSLPAFQYEHKEMMHNYNHYAMAGILIQDEPVGSITLGGPIGTIIKYNLSEKDSKTMIEGMKSAAKIFFAAGGCRRVITSHRKKTILYSEDDFPLIDERGVGPWDINVGSAHPQGGNRMGGEANFSVVDSYCRFHGIENLFVCDASIFPTSVGVNPQLTVMAIATRVAEHIGENWDRGMKYTQSADNSIG